jgi:hypothetical protein
MRARALKRKAKASRARAVVHLKRANRLFRKEAKVRAKARKAGR